jgi:hypothetical protein
MAVPVAIATGVLTDADHVVGLFDSIRSRYMLSLFHAWEYSFIALAVLLVFWYHPLFLAAILGHLGHLLGDQLAHRVYPLTYFITYRASRGFARRRIGPCRGEPSDSFSGELVPLWGRVEPWLWRLVSRARNGRS